jgi:signal transduction histidine kinase
MTLGRRLAVGMFATAAILIVPLLVALRALDRVHASTAQLRDGEFAASLLLGRIRSGLDDLRRAETALVFVHDIGSRDVMSMELARVAAMADSLELYELDSASQQLRLGVQRIAERAPAEYQAALAGRAAQAENISTREIVPAIGEVERSLRLAERSLRERTRARVAEAADLGERAQLTSAVALLVAAMFAFGIGFWLTRSISRPVRDLERGMQAVADGDFSHPLAVSADRPDEFGRLASSFQSMSRQLAEVDRMKAEFVSIASHELKTPINVILGYVQLMQEGIFGDLSAKQREVCRTLETQAHSLGRLVKQLLDVSRFEAGVAKLEPRRIGLDSFVRDLGSTFDVLARQREIEFHCTTSGAPPEGVFWDQDRMNEVLGNLLSNAFKFTPRGGRVELEVEAEGDTVTIEVRDTGPGIPADQLPHIFEKFFQADNQHRAAHKGTGLGLAIAKEIVEAHKGTITADSTPGVGTTFTITLPVRVAGRRSSAPRPLAGTAP